MSSHCDETGAACTRHVPLSSDTILAYAAIGSRMSSFHHDIASKLQSLMMAIDEISESVNDAVRGPAETAAVALRELNQLLTVNRALTKAPVAKSTPLRDIIARASERHGVKLRGDVPELNVLAALPSMAHAIDVLLDMLAGPQRGERAVAIDVTRTADRVALSLTAVTKFEAANELVDIAAFLVAREAGTLTCSETGFVVTLPSA